MINSNCKCPPPPPYFLMLLIASFLLTIRLCSALSLDSDAEIINLTMSAGAQRTPQVKGTEQAALDGNGNGNDAGGRAGGAATAGEDINGGNGLLGKVEPIRLVSLPPVSQRGRLDTLGRLRLEPTRTIQTFTRRGIRQSRDSSPSDDLLLAPSPSAAIESAANNPGANSLAGLSRLLASSAAGNAFPTSNINRSPLLGGGGGISQLSPSLLAQIFRQQQKGTAEQTNGQQQQNLNALQSGDLQREQQRVLQQQQQLALQLALQQRTQRLQQQQQQQLQQQLLASQRNGNNNEVPNANSLTNPFNFGRFGRQTPIGTSSVQIQRPSTANIGNNGLLGNSLRPFGTSLQFPLSGNPTNTLTGNPLPGTPNLGSISFGGAGSSQLNGGRLPSPSLSDGQDFSRTAGALLQQAIRLLKSQQNNNNNAGLNQLPLTNVDSSSLSNGPQFGTSPSEAFKLVAEEQQQRALQQILEQEQRILDMLERESRRSQLLQNNRRDLQNVQQQQQRILALLNQQQQQQQQDGVGGTSERVNLATAGTFLPQQLSIGGGASTATILPSSFRIGSGSTGAGGLLSTILQQPQPQPNNNNNNILGLGTTRLLNVGQPTGASTENLPQSPQLLLSSSFGQPLNGQLPTQSSSTPIDLSQLLLLQQSPSTTLQQQFSLPQLLQSPTQLQQFLQPQQQIQQQPIGDSFGIGQFGQLDIPSNAAAAGGSGSASSPLILQQIPVPQQIPLFVGDENGIAETGGQLFGQNQIPTSSLLGAAADGANGNANGNNQQFFVIQRGQTKAKLGKAKGGENKGENNDEAEQEEDDNNDDDENDNEGNGGTLDEVEEEEKNEQVNANANEQSTNNAKLWTI